MAKQFRPGDWRSGYYRDQTFMFAIGELTVQQWFAQLYAHADVNAEPASAGRQMNGHFATRSLDANGEWKNLAEQYNSSPDISPTGGQMPRLLGLALASKMFRQNKALHGYTHFSDKGNEVAFGTIGDASTSEGPFWESMNAAGVLQVPMAAKLSGQKSPVGHKRSATPAPETCRSPIPSNSQCAPRTWRLEAGVGFAPA